HRHLADQLAAAFAVWLIVTELSHHAELTDSAALTELACLIAAMHAQLAARDPRLLASAWTFGGGLRDLHRVRDGRHGSLAGYLRSHGETLAELLAPTNLHASPDGSISCNSLGALAATEVH